MIKASLLFNLNQGFRVETVVIMILLLSSIFGFHYAFGNPVKEDGLRPNYIYDKANLLTDAYTFLIDKYLRELDDSTTVEIVIYTIPSFHGHGITKDGHEIQDRDDLAYYIFNEVTLDGIEGIGKKGKDNGLLILYSIESQAKGGSMRIEVGKGLEGSITDGVAGAILDSYLVPARQAYESTGNKTFINSAFLDTVTELGQRVGNNNFHEESRNNSHDILGIFFGILFILFIPLVILILILLIRFRRGRERGRGRRGRGYGGDPGGSGRSYAWGLNLSGGGYSGGGYTGGGCSGGGTSGGGGAGR